MRRRRARCGRAVWRWRSRVLYRRFEFGRHDGGLSAWSIRYAARSSASPRIRALEAENDNQRRQLEAAEVARRVDREGYAQVERSLGDMQSQIARLNQDLSFYRGLVQPESLDPRQGAADADRAAGHAGRYPAEIRAHADRQARERSDGTAAAHHRWAAAGQTGQPELRASLAQPAPEPGILVQVFQDFDEPVTLPRGFEPTRVGVEIHSGRDTAHSFRQAFVWKAQGMSVETDANGAGKVRQMFKPKPNKALKIDTSWAPKTRINGDVEFVGGLHLDGRSRQRHLREPGEDTLSVSEAGLHRGLRGRHQYRPERGGEGRYRGRRPGGTGPQGASSWAMFTT